MPFLSIIITFFNKKYLIFDAINSIINQINDNDEIIVVNDCSNDLESLDALHKIQKDYPKRIRFFNTNENQGAASAKHLGISKAENNVIVLLDADDTIPRGALDVIREAFNHDPSVVLIYGNYLRTDKKTGCSYLVDCSMVSNSDKTISQVKLAKNWILLGTSPFKRNIYLEIGGFDQLYPKTDDVDFQRRLLLRYSHNCKYINEHIYNWNRYPDGNNSNHKMTEIIFSDFRNLPFYYKFLSKSKFLQFFLKRGIQLCLLKLGLFYKEK